MDKEKLKEKVISMVNEGKHKFDIKDMNNLAKEFNLSMPRVRSIIVRIIKAESWDKDTYKQAIIQRKKNMQKVVKLNLSNKLYALLLEMKEELNLKSVEEVILFAYTRLKNDVIMNQYQQFNKLKKEVQG